MDGALISMKCRTNKLNLSIMETKTNGQNLLTIQFHRGNPNSPSPWRSTADSHDGDQNEETINHGGEESEMDTAEREESEDDEEDDEEEENVKSQLRPYRQMYLNIKLQNHTNMKIRNLTVFIGALMLIAQAQMVFAQHADKSLDGWTLLGTRTVDYTLDRDVVAVKDTRDILTALKFKVKNGTLNMHKCTVHFADGETKDIEFSEEVNKANDGLIMDLKGSNRKIEKVTFWYDTKNTSDNKSIVELWGKK